MEAQLTSIGITFALACFGMMTVAWWNAITSPTSGKPNIAKFWNDNKQPFIFSAITNLLLVMVLVFVPEIAEFIQKVFGISITVPINNGSGFILGVLIYDTIRKRFKLKGVINTGQQTTEN